MQTCRVLSNLAKKQDEKAQETESDKNSQKNHDKAKKTKRQSDNLTIKLWWVLAGIAGAMILFLNPLFNRSLREKLLNLFGTGLF